MATFKVIGLKQDGKYMDDNARNDVIKYVTRADKTSHHYVGGMAVNVDNAVNEMTILAKAYNNDERLRLRHSVIGFDKDKGITLSDANQIAKKAVEYFGNQYQTIYAVHEDTDNIHAHIVMNSVSYIDGRKYYGTRKEYYDFIKYMTDVVRPYGIPFIPVKDE